MIDHLLTFSNEDEALSSLANLGLASMDDDHLSFNSSNVLVTDLIINDAAYEFIDDEMVEVEPREVVSGFHVIISLGNISPDILSLPDYSCRLIVDRDKLASKSPNFILYAAPDLNMDLAATVRIDPTFAGAPNRFGVS